ncbi:MAG: cupin domain-containing protein [Lachnospirales bacterium]
MNFEYEDIQYNNELLFKLFLHSVDFADKHLHDDFEILFVLDGIIEIQYEKTELLLQEGNLVIINPNVIHSLRSKGENLSLLLQIPKKEFSMEIKKEIDIDLKFVTLEEMQTNEYRLITGALKNLC